MNRYRRLSLEQRYRQLVQEIVSTDDEPCTYFIRAKSTGLVKIGRALNVEKRLQQLQTSNGDRLDVIRVIYWDEEAFYHKHFAHLRVRGEWFRFDPSMLTFVSPAGLKVEEYRRICDGTARMVPADIGLAS